MSEVARVDASCSTFLLVHSSLCMTTIGMYVSSLCLSFFELSVHLFKSELCDLYWRGLKVVYDIGSLCCLLQLCWGVKSRSKSTFLALLIWTQSAVGWVPILPFSGLLRILIFIYELVGWWMFHSFSMLSWNCHLWKSPSKSSYLRMVLFGCSLNCHLSIYAAECFLRQWEWGVHVWIVVKKHELNCWKWAGVIQTVLLLISCYYGRL